MTEVPQQFRVYILEYMAHLSLKDWRGVGQDFVNLEFVAPGSVHPNDVPGLMDSVGVLLDVLMGGGGAKNLDQLQARPPCVQNFSDVSSQSQAVVQQSIVDLRSIVHDIVITHRSQRPLVETLLSERPLWQMCGLCCVFVHVHACCWRAHVLARGCSGIAPVSLLVRVVIT